MKEDNIALIEQSIDELILDLLLPLRSNKDINRKAFDKLYLNLDELKKITEGNSMISKSLIRLLFLIDQSISAEAEHVHYSHPIFKELGIVNNYITEILNN